MKTRRNDATAAFVLVLAVSGLGVGAGAAAAQAEPAFSVAPVVDGRSTGSRDYLQLVAQPGQSVTDSLVVRNLGDTAVALRLAGVDAATGPQGGATYGLGDTVAQGVGAWIILERTLLVLQPGASSTLGVRVVVPSGARTGAHLGGVAVAVAPGPSPAGALLAGGGVGASVRIDVRRGSPFRSPSPDPTNLSSW